jgi:hypothetical protein
VRATDSKLIIEVGRKRETPMQSGSLAVAAYRDDVEGFARSRAIKSWAATPAAITLGCLSLISDKPIGHTSRAILS